MVAIVVVTEAIVAIVVIVVPIEVARAASVVVNDDVATILRTTEVDVNSIATRLRTRRNIRLKFFYFGFFTLNLFVFNKKKNI